MTHIKILCLVMLLFLSTCSGHREYLYFKITDDCSNGIVDEFHIDIKDLPLYEWEMRRCGENRIFIRKGR